MNGKRDMNSPSKKPAGSSKGSQLKFYSVLADTMLDFPGRLSYTLCTAGCNFRCPICHNRELALSQIEGLPEFDIDYILEDIGKKDGWIDGICLTGGEPLLQSRLRNAIERFREADLAIKLDTNGSFPDRLSELIDAGLLDYVAMDIKAPLNAVSYSRSAGVDMSEWLPRVKRSIEIIEASDIEYEFRTVCVPGMHTPDDVADIAGALDQCSRYTLSAFRPMNTLDPEYEKVEAPTQPEMNEYLEAARGRLPSTTIGNQ
jgi:pyruvate formate lyase activating enzyme